MYIATQTEEPEKTKSSAVIHKSSVLLINEEFSLLQFQFCFITILQQ